MQFTMTELSINLYLSGQVHTALAGTPQYNEVRKAILTEDWDAIPRLLAPGGALQQYLGDKFTVNGEQIFYQGRQVPSQMADRIWRMARDGQSPECLFNFYERLAKNPSYRSVDQLYSFLEHTGIPMETSGMLLTYKKVREDYKDCHSGTVDNAPGTVNEMERNLISDDPDVACHYGFHVGALKYVEGFGGDIIIICRVDPEHVVCVPRDYSAQKMRVCKYEVVGIYAGEAMPDSVVDDDFVPGALDPDDFVPGFEDEDVDLDDLDYDDEQIAPVPPVTEVKKVAPFARFSRMDAGKLMQQPLDDLRKYASGKLKLVGASKLTGGKSALVSKIMKLRKKKY